LSNVKFGRTFRVTIDLGDGSDPLIITPPITIQFTVNRSLNSSLNTMQIDIYNLSKKVRDLIFQEFYGSERKKTITLEAGYAGNLSTIYKGSIFEAYSGREGTNIITSIESRSGSWEIAQSMTYTTLSKGLTVKEILQFLGGQFQNLQIGAIGDYSDTLLRPVVINGSTWEYVKKYSDNQAFIDNEKIYVLKNNETIQGEYAVIDKDTGILQTPRRQGNYLTVTTLFEPRLTIGQEVDLKSSIAPVYDGNFKVQGIQHTGIISEAVNGACQTTVDLFLASRAFETVVQQ